MVLEQGPYLTEADFNHSEIEVIQRNQLTNNPELQPITFRKTPQDKAKRHRGYIYGRMVGGSTVHFTANYWRLEHMLALTANDLPTDTVQVSTGIGVRNNQETSDGVSADRIEECLPI